MRNVILAIGMFMIILVSFCAVDKDNIKYHFISKSIEQKYNEVDENEYFLDDNFEYVDNHSSVRISSKKELYDAIYYTINSGADYSEKYCDIEYSNCINDLEELSKDSETLAAFNNYTHPFNTYDTMEISHDDRVISITINHIYSPENINIINKKVDDIIKNNINNNMTTREKIKVIHDYIIDNTDYDTLKSQNVNDTTYHSNTAYGVLFEGKGICSGYSDTMAIFLNKLNIINYKISTNDHIWNLVYIDGKWYHLDLTWDDPISDKNITRDEYFLITTDNLVFLDDGTHIFNRSFYIEA